MYALLATRTLRLIAPWASEKLNSLLIFITCCKNYQGDHIYMQIENLHTVSVQTAERHV